MSDELEPEIILEEDKDRVEDKVKKIKEQLNQCHKEKQEYLAGWQRSQADFINFRRRQEEQMAEWSKMFGEGLISDILPALDTLDSSVALGGENSDGLKAIRDQLMKILAKHGLMEIKAVGEKFDPARHEAVDRVGSDAPVEMVIEEVQKGYTLNGKLMRASKVKVNK